jgi:hypothetical protein
VARANGISNPDRIFPGQRLNLSVLTQPQQAAPNLSTQQALHNKRLQASTNFPLLPGQNPILQKTLDRAVEKGFIPAEEKQQVYQKILGMARHYQFAPDDFARLTLMESGGMNPQASNGRCHGIIQFCDGENRGAASVGLKDNPRAILGMGLLQQLDLVDRYFSQAGLRVKGPPLGLDDLYLTVLTPAAKKETRPNVPLDIAGPQARYLHVGQDTRGPITRNSILDGLYRLTNALLPTSAATANAALQGQVNKNPMTRLYGDVAQAVPTAQR